MTLIPITKKTTVCFVDCGKEICTCKPSKTIKPMIRQIEIKKVKTTLLAVELPNDESSYFRPNGTYTFDGVKYQYIGTLDQMTEEVWKDIVDQKDKGYGVIVNKDYVKDRFTHSLFTSTESGLSLLKANGVDLSEWRNCHVFIK